MRSPDSKDTEFALALALEEIGPVQLAVELICALVPLAIRSGKRERKQPCLPCRYLYGLSDILVVYTREDITGPKNPNSFTLNVWDDGGANHVLSASWDLLALKIEHMHQSDCRALLAELRRRRHEKRDHR